MRSTILHFYALCTFPKAEALRHARAQGTNNIPSHVPSKSTRRTVSVDQLSVRSLKVSRSKDAYAICMCSVHSARAMHVHYATYHQMQCTIELRTLNSSGVPNLVSLVQNFLELEDPSRIKFFGPGACSLHLTKMGTRKACRLWQYTCDLQVWDRWCTSPGLQWRQKNKRCKTLARALHVHTALQPIKSYGAKYTMPRSTHLPSLVSLAKKFLPPEDPTSKSFPTLARAACTLQERQPQKHTRCGCIRVTCKFGVGGASRLACRVG